MNTLENNISYTIFEYLEGNLSAEDVFTVELLIETDSHWKKELEMMKKAYLSPNEENEAFVLDTTFKESLYKKAKLAAWIPYSIAASLLLFLSIGYLSLKPNENNKYSNKVDVNKNINPIKIPNIDLKLVDKENSDLNKVQPNEVAILKNTIDKKPIIIKKAKLEKEKTSLINPKLENTIAFSPNLELPKSQPIVNPTFIIETENAVIETQKIVAINNPNVELTNPEEVLTDEIKLNKQSGLKRFIQNKTNLVKLTSLFNRNLKKIQTPDLIFEIDKSNFSIGLTVKGHN